jgi:hypothetical protein
MNPRSQFVLVCACASALVLSFCSSSALAVPLEFGPEQFVKAGGADIAVTGYSVPSYADWNNDTLPDLIVGEGGNGMPPKVRVYLNTGTRSAPSFGTYAVAKSNGADLTVPTSGCLGIFPRTVYWDGDVRKDLLVGQADGQVKIFLNNGTDANPTFDGGAFLQVGAVGAKMNIDVGDRATPSAVDWNNDNIKDLVVGGLDGRVRVFLNEGTDSAPDFRTTLVVGNVLASSGRASPVVLDLNGDGKKDILTGDTNGQLSFYGNTGSDAAPSFATGTSVTSNGVAIDLAGTPRSRPFVCDWTGDGRLDLLVGAGDGKIHLYQGVPEPTTAALLAVGAWMLARRRR